MLKISNSLTLPLDFATQTVAILARKRVGKTYTASVIAEECVENQIPFVVLDPTGAWYGLRSSADGKKAGYPVVIIGGIHGDVPLDFTTGKTVAEFIVDNPGYYVIDLSGSESDAEQDRFATAFAQRLYRLKDQHRQPLHLFVDEADSFAPQRPMPGQQAMLGAFEAIVRRGGIRGIGMTMITQRPAVLNKNVLTQCEVIIALQTTGPQDQKAVEDWVKMNATAEQHRAFMDSLASLGQGEAWVWSPAWLEIFERVQIRTRRTFNSSATPKVGDVKQEPAKLADVDLNTLRTAMATTIEKAKADDPKTLKKRIAELEKEVKEKPTAVAGEPQMVEVPVLDQKALDELMAAVDAYRLEQEEQFKALVADIKKHETVFASPPTGSLYNALMGLRRAEPKLPSGLISQAVSKNYTKTAQKPVESKPPSGTATNRELPLAHVEILNKLSGPQKKLLNVLKSFEPLGVDSLDRSTLAVFADVSPRSSSFANNLSALKTASNLGGEALIEYLSGGKVRLTDIGRNFADGSGFTATSNEDLLNAWCTQLKSGPQSNILRRLFAIRPSQISRGDLAANVEVSETSSSFANNLSRLRTLGLIDYGPNKTVFATDLLFPFG